MSSGDDDDENDEEEKDNSGEQINEAMAPGLQFQAPSKVYYGGDQMSQHHQ